MDGLGNADTARLCQGLQSGGNIHPVAVEIFAVLHHVAEINADAYKEMTLGRQVGINLL